MTLKEMLGQKLIFGFHGTTLPPEFKDLIRQYKIGNVILFQRNIESAEQTRRLCREIQALIRQETGYPAFIVIDQEGGMVSRLPGDAVNVPGAMALAAAGDPENARTASWITIRQLKGIGANFNMAPVLDVNSNPRNPVIGVRSFGDCPQAVAEFGCAAIEPYRDSGILCCIKHFPGHGDTAVDSHLGLPRVDKTEQELEDLELIPFRRAIRAGAPAVMMSHVLFPKLEPEQLPCTMSRRMTTGLLRQKLGFQGLILTDCMEMGAIQDHFGTPEGVVAAIRAGADLAEISSTFRLEQAAAEAVTQAAEKGLFSLDEIRESVERILLFKQRLLWEPEESLCNWPEDRQLVQAMSSKAITQVSGTPFAVGKSTFFCGCADYRASGVGNETGSAAAFPGFLGRAFGAEHLLTPTNPEPQDIQDALRLAEKSEAIVFGTCNAHLFRGQLELGRALAALGKPMAVAAMRNPYDLSELPENLWKLAAYDYAEPALQALAEVLRGAPAPGRCPVDLQPG